MPIPRAASRESCTISRFAPRTAQLLRNSALWPNHATPCTAWPGLPLIRRGGLDRPDDRRRAGVAGLSLVVATRLPHQSTTSRSDKPSSSSVIVRGAKLAQRAAQRPGREHRVQQRGQHRDRQSFQPAFPVGPFFAQCRLRSRSSVAPLALPTAESSHLLIETGSSVSRKRPSTTERSSPTICPVSRTPANFKLRCAAQTREYPTTGQAAAASGARLDA